MNRKVDSILRPRGAHWVGDGFPVRTVFAAHSDAYDLIDPFLLCDYAGPHTFAPSDSGEPRGVDEHPHRGFETVTIVYQGALEHRDSAGHRGAIGPGDVQWMTAASGVVHEEKHEREFTRQGGTFEVVQLWVNLPAKDKMSSPRYQELTRETIPQIELPSGAGTARIIAGELFGTQGPAATASALGVWDIRMKAGAALELNVPRHLNALVLTLRGALSIDSSSIRAAECAALDHSGDIVTLQAIEDATVLVLSGEPIGEPVVAHGPFVMNTRDEIKQAMIDYQSGRMGTLQAR